LKVRAATLDDLLHEVFRRILATGKPVVASRDRNLEKSGALFELTNPRARMSRTESRCLLFGALGEFIWYLSGSDDLAFIRYYIPDYPTDGNGIQTVRAAYGPRLKDQTASGDPDLSAEGLRHKPQRGSLHLYASIPST
jgi:thymidylate synthase